ncbi:MAG: 30S ribosomal protein S8 [Verrucomicrobia bacterium]|mgnify:FL=1|jgi:small subunit ribosomal protein S8|nr:30S ribosomal protein S8 [Opitutales bacterium]NBV52263.1 30S ribosomal protein S8 [Verrucomicrobiota bacterium]
MSASTDTVGDFLTSIRNASQANKAVITVQWSRLREGVAKILVDAGYVASARKAEREGLPVLELTLKYVAGVPAITSIERVSTPGRRVYAGYTSVPKVIGGMGVSILTTSRGVMTDAEARRQKVGGELLAKVW